MWALYNLAHKDSSIKSLDGDAWIRILGFFATKTEALAHTKNVLKHDSGLEIRLAPANEFRVMLRSRYMDCAEALDMKTRDREAKKHAFLLEAHNSARKDAFEEVSKNAKERQMGELKFSESERIEAHAEEFVNSAIDGIQAESQREISNEPNEVARIAKDLEVRMQRFAALALIPDYEHSQYLQGLLTSWESKRDSAYAKCRNETLSRILGDRSIPSFRSLSEDWVTKNPPPRGFNVWGQRSEDMWICDTTRRDAEVTDSEVKAWLNTFKVAREEALWNWLGEAKPDRSEALKVWFQQNDLPDDAGAEPAVAFLKSADTESEIADWIKTCPFKDFDVACVAMYEWIKLRNASSDRVHRTFRNPMVGQLHAKKDFQKAEALKLTQSGNVKEIEVFN
jgi:hypothetical protein